MHRLISTLPGPEVIHNLKFNSLSMKLILLINVKMPKIVGILTFMNMINTTFESVKVGKVFIVHCFSFYEQLKFHAQFR